MKKEQIYYRLLSVFSAVAMFKLGIGPAAAADGEFSASNPMVAQSLGDLISNGGSQTLRWTDVLSWISYIMGALFAYSAIKKFKHITSGGDMPLSDAVWRMAAGAALVALPWTINMVLGTLGLSDSATTVNRGAAVTTGTGAGLDTLMANFVNNIYGPAKMLMENACYIAGILSAIVGLRRLADAGRGGNHQSTTASGISFLVGAVVLVAIGQMMNVVTDSVFGVADTGTFSALAFVPPGISTAQATNVFAALFNFVELIGWVAFIRGVFILRSIAEGKSNRTPSQAFIFLIAGVIAANMSGFIKALQTTLGISLIS